MIDHVELFGFNFVSEPDLSIVVDDILKADSYDKDGALPFLITPNVDYIVKFSKDEYKELKSTFSRSAYVLPDGHPIVLASKLFDRKIKARLPGSDLLPMLWEKSREGVFKALALTSSESISASLESENPNSICYTLPFFDPSDFGTIHKITEDCVAILLTNDIKIVLIGVSFPKQDIVALNIYRRLQELEVKKMPLFCMLGASFEFYLRIKTRAPKFVQKIGFEWLHRFAYEPKRLFRRYFIEGLGFLSIFFKEVSKKDDK